MKAPLQMSKSAIEDTCHIVTKVNSRMVRSTAECHEDGTVLGMSYFCDKKRRRPQNDRISETNENAGADEHLLRPSVTTC